jgi:hypothetical protein
MAGMLSGKKVQGKRFWGWHYGWLVQSSSLQLMPQTNILAGVPQSF